MMKCRPNKALEPVEPSVTAHTVLYLRSRPGIGELGERLGKEGFDVHYFRRFELLKHLCATLPCQALVAEAEAEAVLAELPPTLRPRVCLALSAHTSALPPSVLAIPEDTHPDEIIARLRALLRRARGYPPQYRVGPLGIDVLRGRASLAGRPLSLPPRELRALTLLADHPWQAVPTAQLAAALHPAGNASPSLVPTYISRLRRRLGARFIETLPGIGYRLTPSRHTSP